MIVWLSIIIFISIIIWIEFVFCLLRSILLYKSTPIVNYKGIINEIYKDVKLSIYKVLKTYKILAKFNPTHSYCISYGMGIKVYYYFDFSLNEKSIMINLTSEIINGNIILWDNYYDVDTNTYNFKANNNYNWTLRPYGGFIHMILCMRMSKKIKKSKIIETKNSIELNNHLSSDLNIEVRKQHRDKKLNQIIDF